MSKTRSAVLVTIAAALLTLAACGADPAEDVSSPAATIDPTSRQSAASPTPPKTNAVRTPGPGETLWRWGKVTIIIPNDSGIFAGPGTEAWAGRKGPLKISRTNPDDPLNSSLVLIDPDSGAVVERNVLAKDQAAIDRVLATVTVSQLDIETTGWPYRGRPTPDLERRSEASVSYLRPSPDSGLYVGGGIGDPGGPFIEILNERSAAFVRIGADGSLEIDTALVARADLTVFERWLAEVEPCGGEVEC